MTLRAQPAATHLVVDQVRRGTSKHEIMLTLPDDLMPCGEWDQVRESCGIYEIAIPDKISNRRVQRCQLGTGHLRSLLSRPGPRSLRSMLNRPAILRGLPSSAQEETHDD